MDERELELRALVEDQVKDMIRGQTQYPENHVVLSLDKVTGHDGGQVMTVGDFLNQDGQLTDLRRTRRARSSES